MRVLIDLKAELRLHENPEKAAFFPRFFKAGPGEYAEGDKFLGVTVPTQRQIAKKYYDQLNLAEVLKLLQSQWHEERLIALFILVLKYQKSDEQTKQEVYNLYIADTQLVNNWDLVDSSAGYIVGPWLEDKPEKIKTLQKLASSKLLWERRIAMISTSYYIRKGRADEALIIAEILLHDPHDLIQKAVGWMLREIGKSADRQLLVEFLAKHYKTMPRTTLRYAIEHFDKSTRQKYLSGLV